MSQSAPVPQADPSRDPHDLEVMKERLRSLVGSGVSTREQALALTELAGRTSLRGATPEPLTGSTRDALLARVSEGLGLERLGDDASLLIDLLDEEDDRDADASRPGTLSRDTESMIRETLRARDRAEWVREGAQCLLGADHLAEPDAIAIETFDETLRTELPRLTRWNHVRGEGLTTASSAETRRFRWRAEAVEIDPSAWDAMSSVAALVAAHPEAEARFAALVAAERGLRALKNA